MESPMRLALFPTLLLLSVGCPEGGAKDSDDTSGGNDSGDSGDIDYGPAGCINLNAEEGDFASINEAVAAAVTGDVVNVCAGAYAETVVLDLGVKIVGAGSLTTSIDAPVNEAAFDIVGDGAGVSGFTITSTRSGVTVDQAADVTLADLVFDSPANYGIEANAATNLSVTTSTFTTPAYGGIFLSGGTATVDSSVFAEPGSYGIWASGDASLTATNNTFLGVVATTTDFTDGYAIYGDGASVVMSHNVVTAENVGVWSKDGGALSLDGDLLTDTPYGVVAQGSAFSADGLEIYGAQVQGLFVQIKGDVTLTNTIIDLNGGTTTGLTSCSYDYADWSGVCGGVLLEVDTLTLDNLTVADYENYGAYLAPARNNGEIAATVSNVNIDNVGRWGLYFASGTGSFDGVTVTGLREPDTSLVDDCTYEIDGVYYTSVDRGAAFLVASADATVNNANLGGGEGWGFSLVQGSATLTGSTISGHLCAGVINFTSGLTVTGSTFTQPADQFTNYGMVFDYQGATVLEGNTFTDTKAWSSYEYDDGAGGYYQYVNSGNGNDFITNGSTACLIKDNVFSGGDDSLRIEDAGCDIVGNSWSGYNGTILSTYLATDSDPVVFSGNSVSDHGGMLVYSTYGTTSVEDLVVGDLRNYQYAYGQNWYHADGTMEVVYEYEYEYAQEAFYSYGYFYMYDSDGDGVADTESGYPAGLKLENVSMGSVPATLVQGSESSLEITDLTAESVAGEVVYGSWAHYAPEVEIDGLEIPNVGATGVTLSDDTADGGYAIISDVTFDTVTGTAFSLSGFAEWSLEDVVVLDAGGAGVSATGDYANYDYPTASTEYGMRESLVSLTGVDVESATSDAFSLTGGVVTIDGSSAMAGDADGLSLDSLSASVTNNIFATNAGFGMACINATLTTCASNDLGSNTLGSHLDCSDECGL